MLDSSILLMRHHAHVPAAAATTGQSIGEGLVLGVIFVTLGVAAYSGKWRSWSTWYLLRRFRFAPLALGWGGIGLLAGVLGNVLPEPAAGIVRSSGLVLIMVGLIGMKWFPRFMLPRWYRIQRGFERRPHRDATQEMKAAERALASDYPGGGARSIGNPVDAGFAATIGGFVGGIAVVEAAHARAVGESRTSDANDSSMAGSATPSAPRSSGEPAISERLLTELFR